MTKKAALLGCVAGCRGAPAASREQGVFPSPSPVLANVPTEED